MPNFVKVTVLIDRDSLDRYAYKAERDSTEQRRVSPLHLIAKTLHDDASHLPKRPAPPGKRSNAEVRDESRERRGGVGAYTEAIPVIPPRAEP